MPIVIVMCALTVLSVFIAFIFVGLMKKKHKKRRVVLFERYTVQGHTAQEVQGFSYYLSREKNYINNYVTFQIVGKICEILSILYSVSSFALNFVDGDNAILTVGKTVIPLMSVVMIVVVLYVVPSRRWAEYMEAWREMDYSINKVLEGNMSLSNMPEVLEKIELSITSDKV